MNAYQLWTFVECEDCSQVFPILCEIKMKSLPTASDSRLHSLDHQEIGTISLMQQIKYSRMEIKFFGIGLLVRLYFHV